MWNPPQPGYTMPIMWTIRECDCSCQWALVWSADAAVVTVTLSGACLPFYLVGTWPLIFTPARLRSPCCKTIHWFHNRLYNHGEGPYWFKTLLRHYAKRALTPRSLNVKLGPRCNYHKGRAAIRHYANQPAHPL